MATKADVPMIRSVLEPTGLEVLEQSEAGRRQALLGLLVRHAYRRGRFTLASGRCSEHYVNCKPVTLDGLGAALLAPLLLAKVEAEAAAVAGLTLGADPMVSTVACYAAQEHGRRLAAVIVRKQPKGHGTRSWLEGPLSLLQDGSVVTVLEDVVTTGSSALQAVQRLRGHGYRVQRVVAIVDRQEGGHNAMEDAGLELMSLFTLNDLQAAHAAGAGEAVAS